MNKQSASANMFFYFYYQGLYFGAGHFCCKKTSA